MIFSRKNDKSSSSSIDHIIVGLGNPGSKYENTRHNAGFICLDKIAEHFHINVTKLKFKGITGTGIIGEHKVLLMKPTTFMNLSGEAVVEAMNFYKVKPENVIVIFDDISLEPGRMRIRRSGSHGGHNGMKNIINLGGSDKFPRIKVGVGSKPHPDYDLADWVLSTFTDNEKKLIDETAEKSCDAVQLIIENNIDKAMNLYNH